MKKTHINGLTGGMNLDSSLETMPQGDYREALHFENNKGEQSEVGVGSNILGTNVVTNPYAHTDDVEIGRATYVKGNGEVIFVHNDTDGDKILLLQDNTIVLLVKDTFLNFTSDLLNNPKCYDDYVTFTDGINEPRMFNILWAKNYQIQTEGRNTPLYFYSSIQIDTFGGGASGLYIYYIYNGYIYKDFITAGDDRVVAAPSTLTPILTYDKDTYYEITVDTIKVIADPPSQQITLTYFKDTQINYNNIFGKIYIFSYQYEYLDGRKSVYSPFNVLTTPQGMQTEEGYITDSAANSINLTVYTGNRNVSRINIAFKDVNNPTNIKLLDSIDKYTQTGDISIDSYKYYNIDFKNDKTYITLNYDNFIRLFDYVPKQAGASETLSDGRLLYGDVIKDTIINNFNVIGSAEIVKESVLNNVSSTITYTTSSLTKTADSHTVNYNLYKLSLPLGYQTGMKFNINISVTDATGTPILSNRDIQLTSSLFEASKSNDEKLAFALRRFLEKIRVQILSIYEIEELDIDGYPTGRYAIQPAYNHLFNILPEYKNQAESSRNDDTPMFAINTIDIINDIGLNPADIDVNNFIIPTFIETAQNTSVGSITRTYNVTINSFSASYQDVVIQETIKSNSALDVGIIYYDKSLRSSGFIKLDTVNTDSLASFGNLVSPDKSYTRNLIQATIDSIPPYDAYKYSFAISKDRVYSDYIQIMVGDVTNPSTTIFNINSVITEMQESNINTSLSPWVLEKGDRVRFIAEFNAIGDYTYKNVFDKEILAVDSGNGNFTIDSVAGLLKKYDIVEVYRFRRNIEDEGDDIYFEIGEIQDIISPESENRKHSGNIQDQTNVNSSISKISYNDAFLMQRLTPDGVTAYKYIVESDGFSDYYDSITVGYTRPTAVLRNADYDGSTTLRFGGKLLPNTNNNYIARFEYDDYDELSKAYGKIRAIRSRGDTIHVYQDVKQTSYYINKTVIKEADGGEQVVLSNKVLNNKTVSEFDFGCVNPESIIQRETHIFFFDAINGVWVRDSKNGMLPISRYGVSEYAKKLGIDVIENGTKVIGGYDERTHLVMWMIEDTEAISFHNESNKWKSFYEFISVNGNYVKMLGSLNSYMTAYCNGEVYIFNSKKHNFLLGKNVESNVTIVINPDPILVKTFDYIMINASKKWIPNIDGDIKVNYGKQQSMIRALKLIEGRYVSDYKRNTLYPNGTSRPDENTGEKLRGNVMTVKLRLPAKDDVAEEEDANISSVISGVTISEKAM